MKKKTKQVYEEYCKKFNIDPRTTKMIVHHYLDVGERTLKELSYEDIIEVRKREEEREKEAKVRGCIYLITPEFTEYLLKACKGLNELPEEPRYEIIAELLK